MASLLSGYTLISLLGLGAAGALLGQTTLPMDADGFMPFQNNYHLWKVIGFSGLAVFQSRWIVQWLYSEKHKESKVPPIFWYQSLLGSLLCLAYFLRQQDSVGVAGYLFSAVPYTRNIILINKKKKRDEAAAARGFTVEPLPSRQS
jgi:lipid-A-disaccharide synthase-like uncharacterized protein